MANVSDTATETTLQLYANPQMIQAQALDKLQDQVLGGEPVVDGNNVVTFLLEMGASLVSGATSEVTNAFESLYPSRANKTSDLYRHMADYDYANLFSTPASTSIELVFDRNFIINNAEEDSDDTNYKKIVIPSYSTFKIGDYTFGIHYPIVIRVRIAYDEVGQIEYDNCNIQCSWDNSVSNPLYVLETNVIEHRVVLRDGINLLCLTVPIKQFEIDTQIADAIPSTGFIKRFDYTNKFYVVRIFNYTTDDEGNKVWVEMAQTFSDIVYDPNYATAKVSVLTDCNKLEVYIPQIYFDKGLIGSRIKCMIYTTQGALDVDISSYNTNQFSASFMIEDEIGDDTYTQMLKRLSVCYVLPLSTKISSGSDGLTFEQLRKRVVNDSTYDLLITANDLTNYFSDQGFQAKRYVDNITNRIYIAQKTITDSKGIVISAGDITTQLSSDDLKYVTPSSTDSTESTYYANHKTFKFIDSKTTMLLPSTVYKYDADSNTCIPMTDDWQDDFDNMTTEQKISELNNNTYTYSPFHLKLTTSGAAPVAGYYDLLNPSITKVTFTKENTGINTQVSLYSCSVSHLDNGTGGYDIIVSLYKTSDLESVVPEYSESGIDHKNIQVVMRYRNSDGLYKHQIGTYIGDSDGHNLIKFHIDTEYKIDSNDALDTTSFKTSDGVKVETTIPLDVDCEFLFFINSNLISGTFTNQIDTSDIPSDPDLINDDTDGGDIVLTVVQSFHLNLGTPVDNLFTNVYVNVEEQDYVTYPTTEYATYSDPIYKRYTQEDYDNGVIHDEDLIGTYVINHDSEGNVSLTIEHEAGEVIISSQTDTYIPPACSLTISSYDSSTGETESTTNTMYLLEPYTATSYPTNKWMPKGYDPDNLISDLEGKYRIQVLDGLQFIVNYLTNHSDAVATSYKGLKLQFTNSVETRYLTIDDVGKYIMSGSNKILLTKSNISNYIGGQYQVYLGRNVVDPYVNFAMLLIGDITGDDNDPENTFTIDSVGYQYLYRRNPDYTNPDYASKVHCNTTTGEYVGFTGETLEEFYNDIDTSDLTKTEIMTKWGIKTTTYDYLLNIRIPWIKTLFVGTLTDLKSYMNARQIINTTANVVQEIHSTMSIINVYAVASSLDDLTLDEGAYVYIEDLEGVTTGSDGSPSLFGNIASSNVTFGGLMRITENQGRQLLIIGDSKSDCVNYIKAINCYSGFAYVISTIKTTINNSNKVTGLTYTDTAFKFLSFTESGKLNLDIDSNIMNWSFIDKWPWELEGEWINVSDGAYSDEIDIAIDTNTNAKILHLVGDVALNDSSNSIEAYVTDANGEAVSTATDDSTTRLITYNVRMLHCDYKLLYSDEPEHADFRNDIVQELRSYFTTVNSAKQSLLEDTTLYYTPLKTIGNAKYKGTNSVITQRPLDITMAFRLHVENFVQNSTNSKDSIKESILTIIDKHIATGTISATDIAHDIRESLSDTILYVDCLGINGDQDLQTLILSDDECVPHLKQELVLNDDGTLGINRGLTLEWSVVK